MTLLQRYQQLAELDGIVYRVQPGRKTFAVELDGQACFVKLHGGVGWREIFKNLLAGQLPIIGAKTEFLALKKLTALGIPSLTIVEHGVSGFNPATQHSYLVTKALINTVSLEDFCATWATHPPSVRLKRQLIRAVALLIAKMHQAGINHRDCYLCHIHLDLTALANNEIHLFLIDLHRAQLRTSVPWRWQVKDIAGLYFSAMHLGLKWRDYVWFCKHYTQACLIKWSLAQRYQFWQAVERRAYALDSKTHYIRRQHFFELSLAAKTALPRNLPNSLLKCEALIATADIIKDDATTTVANVMLADGNKILIKRYNVRTWFTLLKRLCRPSRAAIAWRAGIRLTELGLLTPKPLAMFEQRCGWFKTRSYLITEFIDGEDVGKYFSSYPAFLQAVIYQQLQHTLLVLKLTHSAHGDMKATNFLWHPQGIYLLDLDACRTYKSPKSHHHAIAKDVKRLAKNKLI